MKISVSNLPQSLTEEDIKKLFSEFGEVTSVTLKRDKKTKVSLGYGSVEMAEDAALKALEKLQHKKIEDKEIVLVNSDEVHLQNAEKNKDNKPSAGSKIHGSKATNAGFSGSSGVRRSGGGGRGK